MYGFNAPTRIRMRRLTDKTSNIDNLLRRIEWSEGVPPSWYYPYMLNVITGARRPPLHSNQLKLTELDRVPTIFSEF